MATKAASLTVLVLAAGQGTRLRSKTIKLLHTVAGQPMVGHVVNAAQGLNPNVTLAVVGFQADRVQAALIDQVDGFALQKEQRGTGHAVLQAARAVRAAKASTLLVLNGDLPTLRSSTLQRFVQAHRKSKAVLSVLTAGLDDATGYGRIVRDERGNFLKIVEHKDATREELQIGEINSGIYCADAERLLAVLAKVRPNNSQGEYYITDAVQYLADRGERVLAWLHADAPEVLGVNTREELAASARTLYRRKAEELQERGVTLMERDRTYIDPRAKVGKDTVIYPDVQLEGSTVIGEDCVIRSGTRITDSQIGNGVEIKDHCLIQDARIGKHSVVGPFAHLRPGSVLVSDNKVGNFVELKKATLGPGAKASHLSYLGDVEIGARSNIGAGTITCNYDGKNKFRTVLGKDVFIGSDTQLIAPVTVHDGAYVGAGTTLSNDVPSGALAITRTRQRNIEGWVRRKAAATQLAAARSPESGKKCSAKKSGPVRKS